MFTPIEREAIRQDIIEFARADARITGAAITGSASLGKEDEWSDIDLAFGIEGGVDIRDPLSDFTDRMYNNHGVVTHMDVHSGPWIYRVFLLGNTLQVDLAFVPRESFRALAPTFKLLFGECIDDGLLVGSADVDLMIGHAWLYGLHVRSSIARGKVLQAEHMIAHMRDEVLRMACARHKLAISHGRGYDDLPLELKKGFAQTVVSSLEKPDLARAFSALVDLFIDEVRQVDSGEADKLEQVLRELAGS